MAILPVTFQQNGKDRAVVYIGLSLADQIDTVNTLTRYCIVVGIAWCCSAAPCPR